MVSLSRDQAILGTTLLPFAKQLFMLAHRCIEFGLSLCPLYTEHSGTVRSSSTAHDLG